MSHIDIKHHKHHKTVVGNSPYFRHLNLLQFLNPTGTLWCHVFVWRCTRACHVGSMLVPIFRDASPNLSKAKPARLWTCWTDSVKDVKLGAAGCFWNFWNSGYLMFLDLWPVVSSRSKAVRKPTLRSGSILIPQGIGWTKRKGFAGGRLAGSVKAPFGQVQQKGVLESVRIW